MVADIYRREAVNPIDEIAEECIKFKNKFWYPEIMSNQSHWVPSADDPLSCFGEHSLYDVKRLAGCFLYQAIVVFEHKFPRVN